jgi:sulfate permease, SulP family
MKQLSSPFTLWLKDYIRTFDFTTNLKPNTNFWKTDLKGAWRSSLHIIPMAMIYGMIVFGIPSEGKLITEGAIAGLLSACLGNLIISFLGCTPQLLSGPTAGTTLVLMSVFIEASKHNYNDYQCMYIVFLTVIVAGIFQLIIGLLRLGKYFQLLPHAVRIGLVNGIGLSLIVFAFQFNYFQHSPLPLIVISLAFVFVSRFVKLNFRYILLLLLFSFLIWFLWFILPADTSMEQYFLGSDWLGINLGLIGGDFSLSYHNPFSHLVGLIESKPFDHYPFLIVINGGVALAFFGSMETIYTSCMLDSATNKLHNSDREMLAHGIGNVFLGFVGGFFASGAPSRSVLNVLHGSQTQIGRAHV